MTRARITLYGGVNEIGGNKFLVEEGDARILLDFGTSIGARSEYFQEFLQPRTNSALRDLLRLKLLPRIDGLYRDDLLSVARAQTDGELPVGAAEWRTRHQRAGVDAILLTHAHVDHFQDLAFVDPEIPVYCTPTTHRMLEAIAAVSKTKLEGEITEVRRRSVVAQKKGRFPGAAKIDTKDVRAREIRELAELSTQDVAGFRVTTIPVDHSVPGAAAFFVVTPGGKRILYSGDIRFHGRAMERTSQLLKHVDGLAPDVFLCEGTRIASDKLDGEQDVEKGVHDLAREAEGLVVAEFAWKDTTRFETLQRVAAATERTLLVDPRAAFLLRRLAGLPGVTSRAVEDYGNVGVFLGRTKSMLDSPSDYAPHELGYEEDVDDARLDDAAYRASALAHFERGVRPRDVGANPGRFIVHSTFWSIADALDLAPGPGSRWIRCSTEPYNDDMRANLGQQARWLDTLGMRHNIRAANEWDPDLLTGKTHISGHGAGPDLMKLVASSRAKAIVPIHTDRDAVDHFERFKPMIFREATFARAAEGQCVVEL